VTSRPHDGVAPPRLECGVAAVEQISVLNPRYPLPAARCPPPGSRRRGSRQPGRDGRGDSAAGRGGQPEACRL